MKTTKPTKKLIPNDAIPATSENIGLQRNAKKEFETMVSTYFEKLQARDKRNHELEVSFGTTRHSKGITKLDYDNSA
jgi:hypothetical protein